MAISTFLFAANANGAVGEVEHRRFCYTPLPKMPAELLVISFLPPSLDSAVAAFSCYSFLSAASPL